MPPTILNTMVKLPPTPLLPFTQVATRFLLRQVDPLICFYGRSFSFFYLDCFFSLFCSFLFFFFLGLLPCKMSRVVGDHMKESCSRGCVSTTLFLVTSFNWRPRSTRSERRNNFIATGCIDRLLTLVIQTPIGSSAITRDSLISKALPHCFRYLVTKNSARNYKQRLIRYKNEPLIESKR